ncbi:hypothetical protein BDY19DRAFT_998370 [Irpex rosettiformis]|uniref:Uncharacterized protein n=1 Tax=Irpex rosettiformis TaxID=378272 RepID=A0ACB8TNZ3_9APHY|nr:hypothetical protein BDY19DRAFT_998370 [Irpex rosettiformis]
MHDEESIVKSPSTHCTSTRASKVNLKQLTVVEDSEDDVVETSKPVPSKKTKGKGKVTVHHISRKIAVAGTVPPGVKTTPVTAPIADAENNVFLDTHDDMDVDDVLEEKEDTKQSPLKKAKTSSSTASITKVVSRKKTSEHNAIHDTPVTRVARVMAASNIVSSDEEDEDVSNDENHPPSAGDQASHTIEDQVSNVNNLDHRALMGRDMIDTYQDLLTPPCIREAHTILSCGVSVEEPWTTFGTAMKCVGIARGTELFEAHLDPGSFTARPIELKRMSLANRLQQPYFRLTWDNHVIQS